MTGKNVAFKFLAGPYFRCLPRHGRIGTSASTSSAMTTTSTVSTASRAASVCISTHVEWNPWILFSWDLYDPLFVLFEGPLGLSYERFSRTNVSLPTDAVFVFELDQRDVPMFLRRAINLESVLEECARANPDACICPLTQASVDRAHQVKLVGSNSRVSILIAICCSPNL
jgi:hypothetical protein